MADEDTVYEKAMDNLKEAGQRVRATQSLMWVCPVSADCLPLSHGASSQSNLFVL